MCLTLVDMWNMLMSKGAAKWTIIIEPQGFMDLFRKRLPTNTFVLGEVWSFHQTSLFEQKKVQFDDFFITKPKFWAQIGWLQLEILGVREAHIFSEIVQGLVWNNLGVWHNPNSSMKPFIKPDRNLTVQCSVWKKHQTMKGMNLFGHH